MPYRKNSDLPNQIKDNLPKHGQEIYREAFNHATEQYDDPKKRRDKNESGETVARKVAWSAVKKEYKKDKKDEWVKK